MKIIPRKPRFAIDWTEIHWVDGDAQLTHTVNTLSLLLPAGERWFVKVFRDALPLLRDDELRKAVRGFIGQEANHAVAHERVLELFAAQGIDVRPFTKDLEWLFDTVLADQPFGIAIPHRFERSWLVCRISLVAGIEHYTTMLGAWVLEADALERASRDKAMMALLKWHGAEEVEHRSVAFDVFEHLDGSYANRVTALAIVLGVLTHLWVRGVSFMMHEDPTKPGRPKWRAFLRAGERGLLPTPRDIGGAFLRYLRPWHHPSTEREPAGLASVLDASSFAAARPS